MGEASRPRPAPRVARMTGGSTATLARTDEDQRTPGLPSCVPPTGRMGRQEDFDAGSRSPSNRRGVSPMSRRSQLLINVGALAGAALFGSLVTAVILTAWRPGEKATPAVALAAEPGPAPEAVPDDAKEANEAPKSGGPAVKDPAPVPNNLPPGFGPVPQANPGVIQADKA